MLPKEIIDKMASGKFWLTIISGFVFAYAVYIKFLNPEATATILTMVFISYFQKENQTGGNPK